MESPDPAISSAPPNSQVQLSADLPAIDFGASDGDGADGLNFRELFHRQKRIFDLAMTASQMGTWRYTLADNVCVYDENAQLLYGITEPRFLHDEEGVKSKFHPDDLDLMWTRVGIALDPCGDGRYDVEYRVKQIDGSWRWLSAWGLVEFEGEGPSRKPVAIVGASRDLTERKHAEQLQRLLLNELGHRIKNTFARIQAVVDQTLKGAADVQSARDGLNRRISSMAKVHDLLTSREWSGAELSEVVAQAIEGFNPAQLTYSGPAVELTERQTLGFSMALHELVTNATKYGALSRSEGHVIVSWELNRGQLRFEWTESGGPPVSAPTEQGFGTRLLERIAVSDLCGSIRLDYAASGLRCEIVAVL